MKRLLALAGLVALIITACSTAIKLNGTYTGDVYADGYYIGAMSIDVTTSGSSFSGTGCFVGIDLSTACNAVNGTISGHSVSFTIGGLRFSGTTDGNKITTTFDSSDGSVSGSVTFKASSTQSQALARPDAAAPSGAIQAFEQALKNR